MYRVRTGIKSAAWFNDFVCGLYKTNIPTGGTVFDILVAILVLITVGCLAALILSAAVKAAVKAR